MGKLENVKKLEEHNIRYSEAEDRAKRIDRRVFWIMIMVALLTGFALGEIISGLKIIGGG